MMRFVAVIISALVLLGLVGAGWYYRPWSDYAPARIRALDDPAQYPQTYQRMDEFLPHTFIAADARRRLGPDPSGASACASASICCARARSA